MIKAKTAFKLLAVIMAITAIIVISVDASKKMKKERFQSSSRRQQSGHS